VKVQFQSLRWRLQSWYGLILGLVTLAFCLMMYRLAHDHQVRALDRELRQVERQVLRGLFGQLRHGPREDEGHQRSSPPEAARQQPSSNGNRPMRLPSPDTLLKAIRSGELGLPAPLISMFQGTEPGFAYFSVRDPDGKVILESTNAPEDLRQRTIRHAEGMGSAVTIGNRRESAGGPPGGAILVVGRDFSAEFAELHRLGWSIALAGASVWAISLLGGWWLAGRAIQPIARISATASRIAAGNLAERIDPSKADDELGKLIQVLNRTFDQLQAAVERQRQFTADASHELRTPVTILLSETQRILRRPRGETDYQDALRVCQITGERMKALIESLLILARQDEADQTRAHCNLATIASETTRQALPAALRTRIQLHGDFHEVYCRGDPAALAILADNLVINAIRHNQSPGNVWISTHGVDGVAELLIRDDGPGIAAEHLDAVFDRFYRLDAARTPVDDQPSLGLGLAIARSIARAHGGDITVTSEPGKGATFILRLPSCDPPVSGALPGTSAPSYPPLTQP